MKQCKVKHCIEYGDNLRIFGPSRPIRLPLNSKIIIEEDLGYSIDESASSYDRFIYKNTLYHTINYARLKKRNNSTIITNEKNIAIITDLMVVRRIDTTDDVYIIIGKLLNTVDEEMSNYQQKSSKLFSSIAVETNSTISIKLTSIRSKFVYIPISTNKICFISLVNILETD